SWRAIRDVLAITVLTPDLNDESAIAALRDEFQVLLDQPLPRREVIRLDRVNYLSSSAVGMLLAHFQRLDREGGTMRLCHIRPNVMSVLELMRLPMLVDIFPTFDDAMVAPWE